jgi:hypothetical protein
MEWLKENKLTNLSHPSDWMDALLPLPFKKNPFQ